MKMRQRITGQARQAGQTAGSSRKSTTFATCLCFRVTSQLEPLARVQRHLLIISSWQLLVLSLFTAFDDCAAVGYSYASFEGPVVGPEHLVTVPDAYGGGTHSDYVARPEYSFAYGIEDGKSRVLHNRKETRHGDEVRGVYSVVDPDGTLRVVKYTADDTNGFQAEVITDGVGRLHGHGSDGGVAQVEQEVEHEQANEVEHDDGADDEEDGEDVVEKPKQAQGQYKVHEDHEEDEGKDDGKDDDKGDGEGDGEGEGDSENEGGGDHEEYEGSSEEGYEDAKKQEADESSEEY